MVKELISDLRKIATKEKAASSSRFFKSGEGEYGYGDKFIGVTVPEQRLIARKYKDLSFEDLELLLKSEFHEERLVALLILVMKFKKADKLLQDKIFEFYFYHTKYINNWDLVDTSAPSIVGQFLIDKKITLLLSLSKSENIWERRIAIVSTLAFIRAGKIQPTQLIADLLLDDKEDLIQKAVGWMLRELGKKFGNAQLEKFLIPRYKKMGRTTLRYAIEKFDERRRKDYLSGSV